MIEEYTILVVLDVIWDPKTVKFKILFDYYAKALFYLEKSNLTQIIQGSSVLRALQSLTVSPKDVGADVKTDTLYPGKATTL